MRQVLRAGALGRPRGMGWRERWEGGSGRGTHLNPWLIPVSVWQKPLKKKKNHHKIKSLGISKKIRLGKVGKFLIFWKGIRAVLMVKES